MGLSDVLRGWIARSDSTGEGNPTTESPREPPSVDSDGDTSVHTIVYECRNCGTTVSSATAACPTCESDAIAEYPIE